MLEITFKLRARVDHDDSANVFVARCLSLNVLSQGETKEQARESLEDAVELYIRNCYRRNILDDVLHEQGFEALGDGDGTPDSSDERISVTEHPEYFSFVVPLNLTHISQSQGECLS